MLLHSNSKYIEQSTPCGKTTLFPYTPTASIEPTKFIKKSEGTAMLGVPFLFQNTMLVSSQKSLSCYVVIIFFFAAEVFKLCMCLI